MWKNRCYIVQLLSKIQATPDQIVLDQRSLTHFPSQLWCKVCVESRVRDSPRTVENKIKMCLISLIHRDGSFVSFFLQVLFDVKLDRRQETPTPTQLNTNTHTTQNTPQHTQYTTHNTTQHHTTPHNTTQHNTTSNKQQTDKQPEKNIMLNLLIFHFCCILNIAHFPLFVHLETAHFPFLLVQSDDAVQHTFVWGRFVRLERRFMGSFPT